MSDAHVSVQILGGHDLTPEGEAFMARHGIDHYPTLMAMTQDGSVIDADLLDGQPRDVDELLTELKAAVDTERAFVQERQAALDAGDGASLANLASRVEDRGQPERSAALLEQAIEAGAGRDAYVRLVALRRRLGDDGREREVLDRLLRDFPTDAEAPAWRIRMATAHLPEEAGVEEADVLAARHLEALEALRADVASKGDRRTEAHVRFRLAELLTARGDATAAKAQLVWIVEHAPETKPGLITCILLARKSLRMANLDAAKGYAAKVLEAAPKSKQAVDAHELLGSVAYAQGDAKTYLEHLEAVVRDFPGTVAAERAEETIPLIQAELKGD